MQKLVRREPSTVFYLSYSGHDADLSVLRNRFRTIVARTRDNHRARGAGHQAQFYPVVDLFALGCCNVVLATPLSSFSHYAANLLGPRSTCLLPPAVTDRAQPRVCSLDVRGLRHVDWTDWCRTGERHALLSDALGELVLAPAQTKWLPVLHQ